MSNSPEDQRAFIRCTTCGEIMTGTVTQDGVLVPVGVDNDGKCGDAEFEVVTMQDPAGSKPESV